MREAFVPFHDLHQFLELLESRGELARVTREVDRKYEVGAVTKKCLDQGGPALFFEHVKGYRIPVVTGLAGSQDRCFMALETTRDAWPERWEKAVSHPLKPALVGSGPCKETIRSRENLDLASYPILWHSPKDRGYYLSSAICIMKDPDTGSLNTGIYRGYVFDRDKVAVFINSWQDGRVIAKKYLERGQPCPMAMVVGTDPVILHCAALKPPYGVSELEIAGGIRGEAVEVVRCETIDVEVPASAELVIEGEFLPGEEDGFVGKSHYIEEGPFGEYTGYYGDEKRSPVLQVNSVTHRSDLIYHSVIIGIPPGESGIMYSALRWVVIYNALKAIMPREHIRGINVLPESGAAKCVISIKKTRPMQGKLIAAAALASAAAIKKVVVVDHDIDPFNLAQGIWAEETRARFEDYFSFEAAGSALDPVAREETIVTKIGVDATIPLGKDKIGKLDILRKYGPATFPTEGVDLADYIPQWKRSS